MKARLGAPEAITATAEAAAHGTSGGWSVGESHKLARILHYLVKHRCPYDASVFAREEELHRKRREKTLRKQAALFGFQLTPLPE
jgi:hypothetical protein